MKKSAVSIGLLAVLLTWQGCALFAGGDIPCETAEACPEGMVCGLDKICVDPSSLPEDAGPASDSSVGQDSTAAQDSSTGQDAGSGNDASTGQDAATGSDAASGQDAATAGNCANPPCFNMPDSKTDYCRLGPLDEASCPSDGEDYFGQDGNYHINSPSYAQITGGVVSDLVTGLEWEQVDNYGTRRWAEAISYCEDLDLGGQQDWRLPSYRELYSLVDLGSAWPDNSHLVSAIDHDFFPHVADDPYWSSSGVNGFYWQVDFWGRLQPSMVTNTMSAGTQAAVRCVRGAQAAEGDFTFSPGLLLDNVTALQWQATAQAEMTWADALYACEHLSLGGYDDWRMPNAKELETLVDRESEDSSRTFRLLQNDTGTDTFWSSTPFTLDYGIRAIMFGSGRDVNRYPSSDYRSRCVRGG